MFDDDSTQSFEDLERRLKTPGKKPKPVSKFQTPKPPKPPAVTVESPIPPIKVKDVEPEPQNEQKEQIPDNTIAFTGVMKFMKTPNKIDNEPEILGELW